MNNQPNLQDQGLLRAAMTFAFVILLGMGLLYSLAGTGIGRSLFPQQATGSMVSRDGKQVGSSLVAQPFADARYFQPRPSAAGYNPMSAAGSNQARTNPDLRKRIAETTAAVAARDGIAAQDVPGELVTQSGGGLDPDLSPAGAQVQIARVAAARSLPLQQVAELVTAHTKSPQFGLLGEPRVNVLELNLALDAKEWGTEGMGSREEIESSSPRRRGPSDFRSSRKEKSHWVDQLTLLKSASAFAGMTASR